MGKLRNTAAYFLRPGTPAALWDNQLSEVVKITKVCAFSLTGEIV